MKRYMLLIYNDPKLLEAMPASTFDATMRDCLSPADQVRANGTLLDTQMLGTASGARSVRSRNGRQSVMDGPFTETKELLAGFNLIEAEDMDEAVRIAAEFPWTETGCVEVREVLDVGEVRERVKA